MSQVQTPGDLGRRFRRLTVLNILTNLTVPIASLVDTALLGHLPDIRFLAGVSLAAILFDYVYWTFGFLRMGTTGLTAQAFGARDVREERLILSRATLLGITFGLVILSLQAPLREVGFSLLSGSSDIEAAGRDYFDARIWGAPAALVNFGFLGWFLGREQSRSALIMTVAAHLTNIVLDYVFIVHFGLAARGAGMATAISQYVMLATALIIIARTVRREDSSGTQAVTPIRWSEVTDPRAVKRLIALNVDILVRTVLLVSAFAVFLNFSALLGVAILAANTILYRVQMLAAYFVDGAAFATESLAGISLGARNGLALRRLRRMALRTGLALTAPVAFAVLVAPRPILGLLTSHKETLDAAVAFSPWLLPALLTGSIAFIYDGYFLGLTRGRALRNCMIASTALGFLPLAFTGLAAESNHLLWAAIALFMATRSLTLWWTDRHSPPLGQTAHE